jgi:hypothetical protein
MHQCMYCISFRYELKCYLVGVSLFIPLVRLTFDKLRCNDMFGLINEFKQLYICRKGNGIKNLRCICYGKTERVIVL